MAVSFFGLTGILYFEKFSALWGNYVSMNFAELKQKSFHFSWINERKVYSFLYYKLIRKVKLKSMVFSKLERKRIHLIKAEVI